MIQSNIMTVKPAEEIKQSKKQIFIQVSKINVVTILSSLEEVIPKEPMIQKTEETSFKSPETKITVDTEEPEPEGNPDLSYGPVLNQTTPSSSDNDSVDDSCVIEMDDLMAHSPTQGSHRIQVIDSNNDSELLTSPKAPVSGSTQRKSVLISSATLPDPQMIHECELTPNEISGQFNVQSITLVTMLPELKLESEIAFDVSMRHKDKMTSAPVNPLKWTESCLTAKLNQATLTLLEEIPLTTLPLVKITIDKSQVVSSQSTKGDENSTASLTVGPILFDVPQHSIVLHGMVTRSSRQLLGAIQELKSSYRPPSVLSKKPDIIEMDKISLHEEPIHKISGSNIRLPTPNKQTPDRRRGSSAKRDVSMVHSEAIIEPKAIEKSIDLEFSIIVESFTIRAALLPSLRSQYQIGPVTSMGVTGSRAKFTIDVKDHHLSFNTNVETSSSQPNLSSSADFELPVIKVTADYLLEDKAEGLNRKTEDGFILRKGSFWNTYADIGKFKHTLTTDLINHLLLVQKIFMKEINDVLQKMFIHQHPLDSGSEDEDEEEDLLDLILFSLHLKLNGIQITATTPTNNAVRLESGPLELQLSNRVQTMSFKKFKRSEFFGSENFDSKLFGKLQVDLNVALGQFIRTQVIELSEPEFQTLACFKSRIMIAAALLPPLKDQLQVTGSKAKVIFDVRDHNLSFNTNAVPVIDSNEASSSHSVGFPASANVALPPIHVSAEYLLDEKPDDDDDGMSRKTADGIVLRRGSFWNSFADIGIFEHSLTTDLLNHLLLVQKIFMNEVNEVILKMFSDGQTTVNSSKDDADPDTMIRTRGSKYILFSLDLKLQGIQITATTPTNNALRLETGPLELQLSNRVQNMSFKNSKRSDFFGADNLNLKLFVNLQVDLNVALGQLIRNPLYEEAESEFQSLAYFKTRIQTRNALQDELVTSSTGHQQSQASSSSAEEKEAVLITLKRPLIYIQPLALDKAVLVWLNYKNAYDYWNEQRTQSVKEPTKEQLGKAHQQSQSQSGTLFLQLTVDDLGICLPIASFGGGTGTMSSAGGGSLFGYNYAAPSSRFNYADAELRSALVITLESTKISACSCGSLVSKAKFNGLCFRFADDFETSLDDWKPDPTIDPYINNLCVVSEGTYEICSRTTRHQSSFSSSQSSTDAKWFLNVSWKMEGFDIHVDTSIGKQLSALTSTLTALAGDEDFPEDTVDHSYNSNDEELEVNIGRGDESVVASPSHVVMRNRPFLNRSMTVDQSILDQEKRETITMNDESNRRTSLAKDQATDSTPTHGGDFKVPAVPMMLTTQKKRSRLIEKELNEQAKIINELRSEGASQYKIDQEIKKLHELESAVFNDFRRDVMKKLRRQSTKSSSFRGDKVTRSQTEVNRFSRMSSIVTPEHLNLPTTPQHLSSIHQETRSSIGSESDGVPTSPTSTEASTVRR